MSSRRGQNDVIAAEADGSPYPEDQTGRSRTCIEQQKVRFKKYYLVNMLWIRNIFVISPLSPSHAGKTNASP